MPVFLAEHLDQAHLTRVELVGNYIYIGVANLGVNTSEPKWSIKRITKGTTIPVEWAEGTATFDKIMDDYATYSYS